MSETSAFFAVRPSSVPAPGGASIKNGMLIFTRVSCPNCSPVANFVRGAGLEAKFVDVDQAEGLELARNFGVMATPTVLALDAEGRESFRAFDVREL
ncbi:MAG: glutaredoxin domain-containing protein, partial [Spirochaetaceae bacterium]|nr:glutaredoxin domain-containing protein [Spirochaetaceae bacterium]